MGMGRGGRVGTMVPVTAPYTHSFFLGNYSYSCPYPNYEFLPYPLWVFFEGIHWVWVKLSSLLKALFYKHKY
jgi:hypothetical protein